MAAENANLDPDGLGPAPFNPAVVATGTEVGSLLAIPAQPKRKIDAEAGLAWDRTGGVRDGRIYLVYTDRPNLSSADTDIYVRFSNAQVLTCQTGRTLPTRAVWRAVIIRCHCHAPPVINSFGLFDLDHPSGRLSTANSHDGSFGAASRPAPFSQPSVVRPDAIEAPR